MFLAATAYIAHVLAHHDTLGELLTRSILVSAFALWGVVQLAPGLPGNAVLNDVVIVLFVVDLAVLVSPCSKPAGAAARCRTGLRAAAIGDRLRRLPYVTIYGRFLVPPVGLEPTTFGLKVRCSTN